MKMPALLAALPLIALAASPAPSAESVGTSGAASASVAQPSAAPAPRLTRAARRGLAFAQAHCAQCHGISANTLSANPESPPFEDIAAMPGLTRRTLRTFLRDSHNFPAAMDFTVPPARIDDLAAYIITLRTPGHHPGI